VIGELVVNNAHPTAEGERTDCRSGKSPADLFGNHRALVLKDGVVVPSEPKDFVLETRPLAESL